MENHNNLFCTNNNQPVIIAGPCVAESLDMLLEVAGALKNLSTKLGFSLIFKSSFDKANRTSGQSYRGPGLKTALKWFEKVKSKFNIPILTDIHEPLQAMAASSVCDCLQIPAFLCRQTDLVIAAVKTGAFVNIKKGQFLSPYSMNHIVKKAESVLNPDEIKCRLAVTERGFSFGYSDLVVDMRGLKIMSDNLKGVPIFFDITHSLQNPPSKTQTSGGSRSFAPALSRAATATGYVSGFFLECHPNPKEAKSDSAVQLSITQTETLLTQLIPFWKSVLELNKIDQDF